jgi:hypothetical protein
MYAIDINGSKLAESEYDREIQRNDAWHRTFEASVTGYASRGQYLASEVVAMARAVADAAHGSIGS